MRCRFITTCMLGTFFYSTWCPKKTNVNDTTFSYMRFKPRFSAILQIFLFGLRLRSSCGRFTFWLRSIRFLHGLRGRIFAVYCRPLYGCRTAANRGLNRISGKSSVSFLTILGSTVITFGRRVVREKHFSAILGSWFVDKCVNFYWFCQYTQ